MAMPNLAYAEYMPCLYDTEKDLADRLDSTICRYKGQPVYVSSHGKNLRIFKLKGLSMNAFPVGELISPDDPDFDISSLEATYVNLRLPESLVKRGYPGSNQVYYLTKSTAKSWKQGFCTSYAITLDLNGERAPYSLQSIVSHDLTPIHNAMVGNYPEFWDAIAELTESREKNPRVAISRDLALTKTDVGVIFLYYRCDAVGWLAPGTDKLSLVDDDLGWVVSRYLKELKIE